jgi:ParB family transcriptional regulator, chromosome partitioning protein
MEILQIDPAHIRVGPRLRAVDADYVQQLAESIRLRGLDAPIRVTVADEAGFYRLIAGAHRLEAVRSLGLESIAAIPFEGSEDEADLLEAEENLIRRDLSELDRAAHLARHKQIWLKLYPETKHGGDRRKKQIAKLGDLVEHPLTQRYTAAAAAKLGWSERVVQRAITRYDALPISVRERIARTWLADNGSALDALIGSGEGRNDAQRQHQLLDIMLAPKGPRSVAEAARQLDHLPPQDTDEARRQRLSLLWGKTPLRLQEDVLRTKLQAETMRPQDGFPLRRMLERLLAEADAAEGEGEARVLRAISQGRAA